MPAETELTVSMRLRCCGTVTLQVKMAKQMKLYKAAEEGDFEARLVDRARP